ncbi:hypothetical protein ACEWY4_017289 [Coilia grayii]|uniref:Ig-like domain-containing protein n=1 Tax=Coilia grayii TaxID=363190 RepID=A0ABD1JHV9_9TELE
MSCSYTYPSQLRLKQAYWIKQNSAYPSNLRLDPKNRNRVHIDCQTNKCNLRINSVTASDSGEYYCRITTYTEEQKWIGIPGLYLEVKERIPQIPSASIRPHGDIQDGTDVTLICTRRSHLPVRSYSWYKTGSPTPLQERQWSTYTIFSITSKHSGGYYCQTTSLCGHLISAPLKLQVLCMFFFFKGMGEKYYKFVIVFFLIYFKKHGSIWYVCSIYFLDRPRNTVVEIDPPGQRAEGSRVTLTCSSDANPPVENYTWFKVNQSTPVGSGQQYSISNIRSEDAGLYYCEARNEHGAENSSAVSIRVEGTAASLFLISDGLTCDSPPQCIHVSLIPLGGQSPVLTAVVAVFVCGAVCLLCVFFFMSGNANTIQLDADYQNMNPNTTQPDAVYQILNPNTIQPDSVYQSLNLNTTQPDDNYQTLNPNTSQPDPAYQTISGNAF